MKVDISISAIEDAARRVLPPLHPLAVYLYGSFAENRARSDSDVDLGILAARPVDPSRLLDVAGDLSIELGRDVDLVDLRAVSPVLQVRVVVDGVRLFETDSLARQRFEMQALSAYARLNESRKEILALYGR